MSENKLIIFVKNEEAGKVKTRLAASIGNEKALQAYRILLGYTHAQTTALDVDKEVWYSRFIENNDIWEKGDFNKNLQKGSGLGQRMSEAFRISLEEEDRAKVVLIGSDCPGLTTQIMKQAFEALNEKDLVIGPAEDGGYYLIGLSGYRPELFRDIEWSTDTVMELTLKKAGELGLKWEKLPVLNDVDTAEDWNLVKDRLSYPG